LLEELLDLVTIGAVPWDWPEERMLEETKVADDIIEEIMELDAMVLDDKLEVTVAEVDVGRVEDPEELVLVDEIVDDTEDDVVFAFV
jgi:hypothetical protein